MKRIPFGEHVNIHQFITIGVSGRAKVWSFNVPPSTIGFITRMASNYFPSTKINIFVDGQNIEGVDIQRAIGDIQSPEEYDPPYVVINNIEVFVENGDVESHTFEFLIDGFLILRRQVD